VNWRQPKSSLQVGQALVRPVAPEQAFPLVPDNEQTSPLALREIGTRSGPVSRVLSRALGVYQSAEDGHFSRTPVARRLQQPTRTSAQAGPALATACAAADVLLGLAPGGVCRANRVAPAAGALLPHRFTLTARAHQDGGSCAACGGLLSVALSRALRPVDVIDHPVLWSPDFPLPAKLFRRQRPSDPLRVHSHDIAVGP
jgi:hypothetical protein